MKHYVKECLEYITFSFFYSATINSRSCTTNYQHYISTFPVHVDLRYESKIQDKNVG